MSELESLALLIADLTTQIRALQAENAELQAERERQRQREESETPCEG